MNKEQIISNTVSFVKSTLKDAEGGHDWFHILRVWNNAKLIAKNENVDLFIIELGALLHDIADSKFHNGNETVGPKIARKFLENENVVIQAELYNDIYELVNSKSISKKKLKEVTNIYKRFFTNRMGNKRAIKF